MNFGRVGVAKLCLWMLVGLGCGCSKRESAVSASEKQPTGSPAPAAVRVEPAGPMLDACSLLTNEEVTAVMGEAISETKKLEETERGFHVSMCLFSLPTTINSITVRLVQRAEGAGARDPRQAWNEAFSPENLHPKGTAGREAAELPERVSGVGEEAYWRPERRSGALYVLKGNAYLRVSLVQGLDKEEALRKCSALVEMALKRL